MNNRVMHFSTCNILVGACYAAGIPLRYSYLEVRGIGFQFALNPKNTLQLLFLERSDAFLSNKWIAEFSLEQLQKK